MDRRRLIPLALLLALAVGVFWYWSSLGGDEANGPVVASGTADAEQVQVAALVAGRITRAALAEGDRVTVGQVLYLVDDATIRLQVQQAEAAVRAARIAWEQAADDDESDADIAAKKAQWEQAVAALRIARIQLGHTRISAPATGTITAVAAGEGELASPGRTLATITKDASMFVRVFVPETVIGRVKLGGAATVDSDAGDGGRARVSFVSSEAQFTPSNVETKEQRAKLVYEVRLVPDGTWQSVHPGMPVTVTFAE